MVLVRWIGALIASILCGRGVTALTGQDLSLCPELGLYNLPSILNQCSDEDALKSCMENTFEDQDNFCRLCVIVDEQSLDDVDNCLCAHCGLKALESGCYRQYCSAGKKSRKELILIDRMVESLNMHDKPNFEFESDVEISKVNYFVDPDSKAYRNLLPQEKRILIDGIVQELKHGGTGSNNMKTSGAELEAHAVLKKEKTTTSDFPRITPAPRVSPLFRLRHGSGGDDDDGDDDFPEPKPVPVPGDDIEDPDYGESTSSEPSPTSKCTSRSRCTTPPPSPPPISSCISCCPIIVTTTIVNDDRTTVTTTTTALTTDTDFETTRVPIYLTTTEYDTIWWGTTVTRIRNNVRTRTETEVEGTTRYIKVGGRTVTVTDTDVEIGWRTTTRTVGNRGTTTTTATATDHQVSTVTHHDRTRTKQKTKTVTRTKKMWRPHTKTVSISLSGSISASASASASAGARALRLGYHRPANNDVDDEDDDVEVEQERFGVLNIPDDPAPLLASRRVIKLQNGSNFTVTTVGGSNSSSALENPKFKSTDTSNETSITSSAPQATTAMIVYTTLAVSVATSMMLAFSYHTNLNPDDDTEDTTYHSSIDGNNNDWSDADTVDLTSDEVRSLSDQVPKSGLLPEEIARQLSEDSSNNLLVD